MKAHRGSDALWRARRLQCFHRDGYACTRCGSRRRLECDHVVPLTEGGTNDLDNLRTLCRDCHIAETREQHQPHVEGQSEWGAFANAVGQPRREAVRRGKRAGV